MTVIEVQGDMMHCAQTWQKSIQVAQAEPTKRP